MVDASTQIAGYDFDARRLKWYDWLIILLFSWAPPVAVGWGIGRCAKSVDKLEPAE